MRIFDISVPISCNLPTFPGDPPARIEPVTRLERGDTANVSYLTLSTHCGTHIDVPRHYSDNGFSVDELPLPLLVGKARVVEVHGMPAIDRTVLARLPVRGEERLLIRTGNSALWASRGFVEEYAHLTEDGARYLLEAGVRLVGIDYLSIERFESSGEVHRLLLGNGVVILEGLNLEGIAPGSYELICLPLSIKGGDGAPVRAVLRSSMDEEGRSDFDPHTSKWPLA